MQHLSDIKIKATGSYKKDKQGKEYEASVLCIEDKSTLFEITGVNNTGQWTVRRIFY
jgi:hypothetical protein